MKATICHWSVSYNRFRITDSNLRRKTNVDKYISNFPIFTDVQQTIQIKIMAKSFFGARHALATLYQLIWYDDEEQRLKIVNKAEIIDAPKFR